MITRARPVWDKLKKKNRREKGWNMGPLKSLNKRGIQSCKNREDCGTFKAQYCYSLSGTLCKNNIPADVLVSMEPVLSAEGPHKLQLRGCHANNVLFSVFSTSKNC